MNQNLSREHQQYLQGRGISPEVAEQFGLHSDGQVIVIPIEGQRRLYAPNGTPKIRWETSLKGETPPPFPDWNALRTADLIVEGEFDCMLAISQGYQAVSGTTGSRSFAEEWADALGGSVVILYDNDDAGKVGAQATAETLSNRGIVSRIAYWPSDKPKGYDVTDFFLEGGTKEELDAIIADAVLYEPVRTGLQPLGDLSATLDERIPIPTGFKALDEIIIGLRRQETLVIAARPKVGKSTLAMQILVNAAKQGHRVGLFSLEMSEQQLLERLIAAEALVNKRELEKGLSDYAVRQLYKELPRIWNIPILFDTQPRLSTKKIRERALRAVDDFGQLDVICVDYIGLLDTSEKAETRARQLTAAIEDLKGLAKELDCAVVVLSQVNREGAKDEGEEPQLHQLMESGGVEATADGVLIMWRKRKEEKEAIEKKLPVPTHARMAKNRNGPEDYIHLFLDGPKCMFYEDEG